MNAPSSHYIQLCLFITHGLKLLMVPSKAFKIPHTVVACPSPRRSVSPHVRMQMRRIWDPHTVIFLYIEHNAGYVVFFFFAQEKERKMDLQTRATARNTYEMTRL